MVAAVVAAPTREAAAEVAVRSQAAVAAVAEVSPAEAVLHPEAVEAEADIADKQNKVAKRSPYLFMRTRVCVSAQPAYEQGQAVRPTAPYSAVHAPRQGYTRFCRSQVPLWRFS